MMGDVVHQMAANADTFMNGTDCDINDIIVDGGSTCMMVSPLHLLLVVDQPMIIPPEM